MIMIIIIITIPTTSTSVLFSISFLHLHRRSGFPPLRIYQAKHLQAQLELNAVHVLCRQMSLDAWRRRLLLPECLKWHLADFGGETQMLEMLGDILKRAPEQVWRWRF